ncbi:MAG: hypothetical protein IK152_01210 [Lachnospiraceae bacterium]|nr:hypothetical protein [Lachnospiraceae bacterium]
MKISDSNVTMASQRSYRQGSETRSGVIGSAAPGLSGTKNNTSFDWKDVLSLSGEKDDNLNSPGYDRNGLTIDGKGILPTPAELYDMRYNMVSSVLERIRGAMSNGGLTTSTYYEEEMTSFSAQGKVCTEDGQIIDFNIELTMTRSFMQTTRTSLPGLMGAFMDPLMINTDASISRMADQKFLFDLDCDGTEEWISMPSAGSGFLALDLNGDGRIGDGSELFGTKSGDGFADLAEYDSDGNGWIDENDDIFDKLKVWYKDESGKDVLMDLKEADIGAIYLGSQATDFSLMGSDFSKDAMIRSTGFFLRESGGTGTIQDVDLKAESQEERLLKLLQSSFNFSTSQIQETHSSQYIDLSGITSFPGTDRQVISTTKSDTKEQEKGNKDDEAIERVDNMALRRRLQQARYHKRADEKRRERKELLEEELERLREHRSEEEARLEALFGEREDISEKLSEQVAEAL